MTDFENEKSHLTALFAEKESFPTVKKEATKLLKTGTAAENFDLALVLYESNDYQVQEVGVLILGSLSAENPVALAFLKEKVSSHDNWKVQETLAKAFDTYCQVIGYEVALPVIGEWLASNVDNVRRAVTEGLRVWTSRPYFKENPEQAVALLAAHKADASEYVRKSVGNALRDIGKKFPELVKAEISGWDLMDKGVAQVYKLVSKNF